MWHTPTGMRMRQGSLRAQATNPPVHCNGHRLSIQNVFFWGFSTSPPILSFVVYPGMWFRLICTHMSMDGWRYGNICVPTCLLGPYSCCVGLVCVKYTLRAQNRADQFVVPFLWYIQGLWFRLICTHMIMGGWRYGNICVPT